MDAVLAGGSAIPANLTRAKATHVKTMTRITLPALQVHTSTHLNITMVLKI